MTGVIGEDHPCTLELSGHEVQTAYSGQDGYLLADAFCPDVLLLDIGLPDIDGYALAHRIRRSP